MNRNDEISRRNSPWILLKKLANYTLIIMGKSGQIPSLFNEYLVKPKSKKSDNEIIWYNTSQIAYQILSASKKIADGW